VFEGVGPGSCKDAFEQRFERAIVCRLIPNPYRDQFFEKITVSIAPYHEEAARSRALVIVDGVFIAAVERFDAADDGAFNFG
jgi:hypothetical protein